MPKRDKRWLRSHQRDPYVKQARRGGYRSRAVFKLKEIDEAEGLLRPGQLVVDIGAAPGGWSQYAAQRVGPAGRVIALDILEIDPINNVQILRGDFTDDAVLDSCMAACGGQPVDVIISDIAPNLSGIRVTDQDRSMQLAELVADFALRVLGNRGSLLIKLFQGQGADPFRKELMKRFQKVKVIKPSASRGESREFYVLARGYNV